MKLIETSLEGVCVIRGEPFKDHRGQFTRNFCQQEYGKYSFDIRQISVSENTKKHTLRGFHYQSAPHQEIKSIIPLTGSLYDVVLDLRPESKTYLKWEVFELSSRQKEGIYVPKGCANCWITMEDNTMVTYYISEFFAPNHYHGIRYNDPYFGIPWPTKPDVISDKDLSYPDFKI